MPPRPQHVWLPGTGSGPFVDPARSIPSPWRRGNRHVHHRHNGICAVMLQNNPNFLFFLPNTPIFALEQLLLQGAASS